MSHAISGNDRWLSSTDHYENFPVGSLLVPAKIRPDIATVYRFARYADDVADEGLATPAQRLGELERLRQALSGEIDHPLVSPLLTVIERHALEKQHFFDLLHAFSLDARGTDVPDRATLMHYCAHSADPVGRIVLGLFAADKKADLRASDAICSALQLINFVQDIGQDHGRGRCYLPTDEMQRFGVSLEALGAAVNQGALRGSLRALIDYQLDMAGTMLRSGSRLLNDKLPMRLKLELRAVIAGGLRMAQRLREEDPLAARIKLGRRDAPHLLALMMKLPFVNHDVA